MHRHAKNTAFAVVVALVFAAAQAGLTAPRKGPPVAAEVSTLKELHAALAKATQAALSGSPPGFTKSMRTTRIFWSKTSRGCRTSRS